MGLDARGYIAIAEIVLYAPIILVVIPVLFRNGFSKKAEWVYLLLLSIFRIVGGVTHIMYETQSNPSKTLLTIFTVTESAGLSQLLVATSGFLGTVVQHTLDKQTHVKYGLLALELLGTGALLLIVVGGTKAGNAKTQDELNQAATFRHIGIIVFALLYLAVAGLVAYLWAHRQDILKYRRKLLLGIACALPFLGVRVLYGVLSAFAPATAGLDAAGHPTVLHPTSFLTKFSTATGSWALFLFMDFAMEYVVVLAYTVVGVRTPLARDLDADQRGDYVATPTVAVGGFLGGRGYGGEEDLKAGGGYSHQTGGFAP